MNSAKHTAGFEIAQPVEQLFPLFSAEGEKAWVPGWDYENVMGTTELTEDYVFLTKTHDHAGSDAIWIVKRYDPADWYVQFYRVEPGDKVGIVSVRCLRRAEDLTRVDVSYEYIALSDRGRAFIEGFTADSFGEFIEEWRMLLNRYFETESHRG